MRVPVNFPPSIEDQVFAIDENAAINLNIGTISATDQNLGDTLTYEIISGNESETLTIDNMTGLLTVGNNTALDFESLPKFEVEVEVSDGALLDIATITIDVNDLNESPIIEDQIIEVDGEIFGGFVIGGVIATDPDVGDFLNYTVIGGTGAEFLGICASVLDSDACGIFTLQPLDFSGNQKLELIVEVTDTGLLTDSAVITIVAKGESPMDELLVGTSDVDTLIGQDGNDTLKGFQSNDTLIAGRGNDQLFGNQGDDRLIGNGGRDLLVGGSGNDRLRGGDGLDSLRGGAGADKFIFHDVRDKADRILDFNTEEDSILISRTGFNLDISEGRLNNSRFTIDSGASDKGDRFVYNAQTGALIFDSDGIRPNKAEVIGFLNPNLNLNASNIRII